MAHDSSNESPYTVHHITCYTGYETALTCAVALRARKLEVDAYCDRTVIYDRRTSMYTYVASLIVRNAHYDCPQTAKSPATHNSRTATSAFVLHKVPLSCGGLQVPPSAVQVVLGLRASPWQLAIWLMKCLKTNDCHPVSGREAGHCTVVCARSWP